MSALLRISPQNRVLIGVALLLVALDAAAVSPRCVRGGVLLVCSDGLGNHYGVRNDGIDTYTRGFPNAAGQSWAQTNTRYGQLTLFSGVTSEGEVWLGRIQKVGWTTLTRFSSSRGETQRLRCNVMTGCTASPAAQ